MTSNLGFSPEVFEDEDSKWRNFSIVASLLDEGDSAAEEVEAWGCC